MTTARYVMQIIIPKLLSKMICQLIYFIFFLNYKYGLFITCTIKGLSKFVQFTNLYLILFRQQHTSNICIYIYFKLVVKYNELFQKIFLKFPHTPPPPKTWTCR